jgi:hypothetical protein
MTLARHRTRLPTPTQTETVTLYSFLQPSDADMVNFVYTAYGNLFNRTPDTIGEEYWSPSIAKSLGIGVPTFGNPAAPMMVRCWHRGH